MLVLADLIAPDDDRTTIDVGGDDRWALTLTPLALERPNVTIQRHNELICAIQPNDNGTLLTAVYRPLDARSARLLMAAAQTPAPDGTVAMRENNWEYLLDQTASNGQVYAAFRGEAHLAFWAGGLGIDRQGTISDGWMSKRSLQPLSSKSTAAQLGVFYSLFDD